MAACGPTVRPEPGRAALVVTVHAEPHRGTAAPTGPYGAGGGYGSGYGSRSVGGKYERMNYDDVADIAVWVSPIAVPAGEPTVMDTPHAAVLTDNGFEEPVLAVAAGGILQVANASASPWTVYSVDEPNDFDLGSLQPGQSASVQVKAGEPFHLLVEENESFQAQVYVAPPGAAAVTNGGGTWTLNNLAPGTYRVGAWHWRLPSAETEVTLSAGEVRKVSLTLSVNNLPELPGTGSSGTPGPGPAPGFPADK